MLNNTRALRLSLVALAASICTFASEAEDNARLLRATVAQLRSDSPVVLGMMTGIRTLNIVTGALPGSVLATTELEGPSVTITVDVAKVMRNKHDLSATVVHEITHADDLAQSPQSFTNMEREDRLLPWPDRRMERRAIQRTGIITGYLSLQYPGRYKPSIPIAF